MSKYKIPQAFKVQWEWTFFFCLQSSDAYEEYIKTFSTFRTLKEYEEEVN